MESTYRQYKENVLKDYDGFVKMIDEIRQGKETPYDHSMEQLEKQATNIRIPVTAAGIFFLRPLFPRRSI